MDLQKLAGGHHFNASGRWTDPHAQPVYDHSLEPRELYQVRQLARECAEAAPLVAAVFGDTCILSALRRRVDAVHSAGASSLRASVDRLDQFLRWLAAVCDACELEDGSAADLRATLEVLMSRCARIVTPPVTVDVALSRRRSPRPL